MRLLTRILCPFRSAREAIGSLPWIVSGSDTYAPITKKFSYPVQCVERDQPSVGQSGLAGVVAAGLIMR